MKECFMRQMPAARTVGLANQGSAAEHDEARVLDSRARRHLSCSFIQLKDGMVAYSLSDSHTTPLVVLVHGYSSPSFVWQPLVERLQAEQLDTLTFDLFGHGFSDRPDTSYGRELFARQIEELIDVLAPSRDVHLIGWSMGAMIVARYATDQVERVKSVTLLSPSGLPIRMGLLGRTAMIPGVGDVGQRLIGGYGLRTAQKAFFEDAGCFNDYMARYRQQLVYSGYRRAMLSTLREMNMDDFQAGYAALGQAPVPVRVLWSVSDRATPWANHATFQTLVPQAVITPLHGVGHASFFERPDYVAPMVIDAIRLASAAL